MLTDRPPDEGRCTRPTAAGPVARTHLHPDNADTYAGPGCSGQLLFCRLLTSQLRIPLDAGTALLLCSYFEVVTCHQMNVCRKLLLPSHSCCWGDRMQYMCAAVHRMDGLSFCTPLHARLMPRRAAYPTLPGTSRRQSRVGNALGSLSILLARSKFLHADSLIAHCLIVRAALRMIIMHMVIRKSTWSSICCYLQALLGSSWRRQ